MLFTSTEDFFCKAAACEHIPREREKAYARAAAQGDAAAKAKLAEAYLPMVAAYVRRMPEEDRTLELVYRFASALEKAVESFDFLQDSEAFSHRLGMCLRRETVRYIADK